MGTSNSNYCHFNEYSIKITDAENTYCIHNSFDLKKLYRFFIRATVFCQWSGARYTRLACYVKMKYVALALALPGGTSPAF